MRLGDAPALPPAFACPFARCLPIIGGSGRVFLVSLLADLSDCAHAGDAMTRHVSSDVASFIKLSFAPVSRTVRPRLDTIRPPIDTVKRRLAPTVSQTIRLVGNGPRSMHNVCNGARLDAKGRSAAI